MKLLIFRLMLLISTKALTMGIGLVYDKQVYCTYIYLIYKSEQLAIIYYTVANSLLINCKLKVTELFKY